MQKILPLTALALTIGLYSTPALADGFYVSGAINTTTQEQFQSRDTGTNAPLVGPVGGPSGTVTDKETDIGFALGVGYKKHILRDDLYIAGEIFYSFENVDTTTLNSVKVNEVSLDSTYGFDVRFGTDVTNKVSVYGLVGATNFDFDSDIGYTFAAPTADASDDEWGFTYGAGVEIKVTRNITTFGEFRLSQDIDFDTPVDEGGVLADEELDYTVLKTGLRYHF